MALKPFLYRPPKQPYLTVVHEHELFLVLEKPSGLLTVPGKEIGLADCLEARLAERYPQARLVHRLDKDTSGLILAARTPYAMRHLGLQFERRQVSKAYIARVAGRVTGQAGEICLPLATDPDRRPAQHVDPRTGRHAATQWQVLFREEFATRLLLIPLTGRSHQLRVHMKSLGHPILGDPIYGDMNQEAAADRLQLHAIRLQFRHPDGGATTAFEAPCPF